MGLASTYFVGRNIGGREHVLTAIEHSAWVEVLRVRTLYDVHDLEGTTRFVEVRHDFYSMLCTDEERRVLGASLADLRHA